MKKKLITFFMLAALVIPMFAATAVFERKRPADLDLTFANSIAFYPVITYAPKHGNTFDKEQVALGKKFISALSVFGEADGKFVIVNGNADVAIQVSFKSFDVKDSGVTIGGTDSVENSVAVKDEWNRQISAIMEVMVLKTADNSVLATEEYKFFGVTSTPSPRAKLMSPEKIVEDQVSSFSYRISEIIFDKPYNQAVTILDTKSKDKAIKEKMKSAKKMLGKKNQDYAAAEEIYKEIYESTDDIAAGYNYAIMLQVRKDFDNAEALIKKFAEAEPKNKVYKKALEDIAKDRAETEIFKSRNQL